MYITYGKMSGGTPDIFNFLVISRKRERFRANNLQGINSSYSSIEKTHEEKFSFDLIFYHIPIIYTGFKML